ncbi:MAG: GIY-YIG nuclease family protein [Fimbriimonas sp.]
MFFTYILQSSTSGRFYVGRTDDLDQRLHFHNTGQSHYTARKGPWVLVHKEAFTTRSDAAKREMEIKRWKSAVKIRELVSTSSQ